MYKKSVCLIVLNNFKNDSRVLKESISLQNNEYKVLVIALYDEGQKIDEVKNNISIHRIKLKSRKWSKHPLIKLIKYFEFVYRSYKIAKDFEICHCNDLNTLPVGVLVKIFNDKKVLYDAHEFESNRVKNQKWYNIKFHEVLEGLLIKFANDVITVSDSIANEYQSLYKISKPKLVLNCPPKQRFYQKTTYLRDLLMIPLDSKIFLYQGALSQGRGIELLLDSFSKYEGDDLSIVFMGYGLYEHKIAKYSKAYKNIYFKSAVDPSEILKFTASADFGVSLIEDICLSYRYSLPNKIFEYIMAGIPVIVSDLPEMKKVINQFNLGVVLQAESSKNLISDLKTGIEQFCEEKFNSGLDNAREMFSWENQEKVLLEVYENL